MLLQAQVVIKLRLVVPSFQFIFNCRIHYLEIYYPVAFTHVHLPKLIDRVFKKQRGKDKDIGNHVPAYIMLHKQKIII